MSEEKNSNVFFIKSSLWTFAGVVAMDIILEGYRYNNFIALIFIGIVFSFISAKIFYFIFGYYLRENFQFSNISRDIEKIHKLRREVRKFQILVVAIFSIFIVSNFK